MTRPSLERFTAFGQAAGSNGTVTPGAAVTRRCHRGRWLAKIEARLRVPLLSTPVNSGSVLLMVEVRKSLIADGASVAEATLAGPGRLAVAGYASTGRGIVAYPNVYIDEDEDATLLATVWNRDDVLATQTAVDVVVTYSDRPIPGADDYQRLGDFSPGTGHVRSIDLTDENAGVEFGLTVPTGLRMRPLHARCTLVAAAGGSTRVAQLNVTIDSNVHVHSANYGQAGGTTITYDWFKEVFAFSGNQWASSVGGIFPMGLYLLKGGDAIGSSTANFAAGDNWGAPVLLVEEWVIPQVAAS